MAEDQLENPNTKLQRLLDENNLEIKVGPYTIKDVSDGSIILNSNVHAEYKSKVKPEQKAGSAVRQ